MFRDAIRTFGVALLAASAWGANWTAYESGPFLVASDAGDKAARARLAELDQLNHTLAAYLGKSELTSVWPIEIVLFANQREYGPHAPPRPLVDGPAQTLAAWTADTPLPHDLLRAFTRQLIDNNAGRMPDATEQGLIDLMATIQAGKDGKITLGSAPAAGELPGDRMRVWAKLQMLATQPEFTGKLRIYFNNLQQGGEEDVAARNAFSMTPAELNQRAAQYLAAGSFTAAPAAGAPINPERDFDQRRISESDVNDLFAALKAGGKDFPADSPRGLLKQRTRDALEQAAKANPRWAEPHAALASLLGDPAAKVKELKVATSLEPRNSDYWQDLAVAEEDAEQYVDADKSWRSAERNAVGDPEKTKVHRELLAFDERLVQSKIDEKKHKAADDADDLERVKKAAAARIRAAEDAANKRNPSTPGGKVVPWWNDEDGQKLSGTLTNVDCQKGGAIRLTIQPATGPATKLMIPDPQKLAVKGAAEARFTCGVQRPAKPINLVHDGMADAQQGTAGNVRMVELP